MSSLDMKMDVRGDPAEITWHKLVGLRPTQVLLPPVITQLCCLSEYLIKVKVTQSCPALCDPMDYTAHGILQA